MSKPKSPRKVGDKEALATGTMIRGSARKLNLVAGLIRGRKVDDALNVLQFSKKRAAVMVAKVVKSAVANYHEQETAPGQNNLVISEARVDGGPIIKRFQPKDRGKAYPIQKKTSHLCVELGEREE